MPKFRPDIKPPMWGPPEAVQYAVRVNAERMGIDPTLISSYIAEIDGSNFPYDFGSGKNATSANPPSVVAGSLVFDGVNDYLYLAKNANVTNNTSIVVCGFLTNDTSIRSRIYHSAINSNTSIYGVALQTVGDGLELSYHNGTSAGYSARRSFLTTSGISSGGKTNIAATWGGGDTHKIYCDGTSLSGTFSGTASTFNPGSSFVGGLGILFYSGVAYYGPMQIDSFLVLDGQVLNTDQIAQLNATPYALLMPVSRPVLGAGGGISFSASCGSTLSSSDIQASIARSLAASASASLTSSDISVTTAATYLLSAACHASVSSSDILASILRDMAADSSASTTASDILAAVARILIASADGSLTGSDIAVSIAAQKIFEAACNASLQSTDVLVSILRQVSAQCDSSLTSQDITLAILWQLVASCAGSLTSSDITVSTVAEKLFQAACAASLTSSDSALNIARTLTCNCNGVVSSSDATLTIAGLITFLAECTASLSGSDVTASIARVLSAESLASVSASDIAVTNLVALAATCEANTSATDVALNLQMYLQAVCDGTLSADDASVSVASLLSAACGATISSSDIRVLFTDEFMLPEVFAAISKITKAYEAESLVTKTLNARSRIEIRRLN